MIEDITFKETKLLFLLKYCYLKIFLLQPYRSFNHNHNKFEGIVQNFFKKIKEEIEMSITFFLFLDQFEGTNFNKMYELVSKI